MIPLAAMAFLTRYWKPLAIGGTILAIVIGVLWYGHTRYRAGVRDTDAKWVEAGRVLQRKAADSATKADDAAAVRAGAHDAQVAQERERIDAAQANGASVFDVLFR